MTNAAEALVAQLTSEGTEYVFGIPGTQNLPILDVIRETPSLRFILTRHEQAAGFMGLGYASLARKPGVVTATEGPGATNLVTPIAAAHKANVPIIAISGSSNRAMIGLDAAQDIDQKAIFGPITRWAETVPAGQSMPELMQKAHRLALGWRPGPVHLDVSREVLLEPSTLPSVPPAAYRTTQVPDCTEASIDAAFDLLKASERPVILTGNEQMNDDAGIALIELAESLGIPVVTNTGHPDAFPTAHSLSLGVLGRGSWPPTLREVYAADLLLVIGGKLDTWTTLLNEEIISPDTRIVLNTKYADDVGRVFAIDHAAIGSVSSFIRGMTGRVKAAGLQKHWLDMDAVRAEAGEWMSSQREGSPAPIRVPAATSMLREHLEDDAVLCLDPGNATKHIETHWEARKPHTFLTSVDWGCVGSAFPTAVGAKLAAPDQQVVAIVGDMGFACNMADLETCVREQINVVVIILNDNGLGNEKAFQNALYGGRHFAVDYQNPDFAEVARVFGAHGERVKNLEELGPALERSLAAARPAIIDVMIDPENLAPVTYQRAR